ncbi:MAG: glycerol-3-phosphate 1-O-acyltransferase PlsY [Acidimicrobiia bacterium]|nr:glycerol-3-phosphate 1-O-acyltransferase PlsY [Acidimicrobiia bacterium]
MEQAAAIIVSYLLGSVSFGIVVASLQGVDIRSVGSGNPGMSNILRNLGKKSAALVLIGDGLKGAGAAAIGVAWIGADFGWVTLFVAVVGHSFPIWHGFRGGKGVATAIGGVMFLAPWIGVTLGVIWIAILVVWRTASIGSLVVMGLLVPLVALSGRSGVAIAWASAIAAFIVVRHASNIRRLVTATEDQVNR